jgi:hypothetical protein
MINIKGQNTRTYKPKALCYAAVTIEAFERSWKLEKTAKAYLRSIIEARSEHRYRDSWNLAFSLKMRDKMEQAAKEVNDKVKFELWAWERKLDPAHWNRIETLAPWETRPNVTFESKTTDYAAAVNAIFADTTKNQLECGSMAELMAVRALQLALGDRRFNAILRIHLRGSKLRIPLLYNKIAISQEMLTYPPPRGENVFRPGDLVAFANVRQNARGRGWGIENAICVGWKFDNRGEPLYDEPLFYPGGRAGGMPEPGTESQFKESLYKLSPDPTLVLSPQADLTKHFAEKIINLKGRQCRCPGDLPELYLQPMVHRITILGGK